MTCTCVCVCRKVEDEFSVCLKTKTPSFISQQKLKLWICVWASMTWLWALESTLPFKIASRNSWETTLKCFVTMPLWQSNKLGILLCRQSFLLHFLSLTCWKLISFLVSIWFFFLWFWKHRAFDYFSQFKCCVKKASIYFYYFNGITVN